MIKPDAVERNLENEIKEMEQLRLQISKHLSTRTISDPNFKSNDSSN